jgi:hypothetical protein
MEGAEREGVDTDGDERKLGDEETLGDDRNVGWETAPDERNVGADGAERNAGCEG